MRMRLPANPIGVLRNALIGFGLLLTTVAMLPGSKAARMGLDRYSLPQELMLELTGTVLMFLMLLTFLPGDAKKSEWSIDRLDVLIVALLLAGALSSILSTN